MHRNNIGAVETTPYIISSEVKAFRSITQLSKGDINSAIMSQAWTISELRRDFGNATRYPKWYNVSKILSKSKGVIDYISSSDEIINRYLAFMYKFGNKTVSEKNPFSKIENPKENVTKTIKTFIDRRYYINPWEKSSEYKKIVKSQEFQEFKSQFDIEGMKSSIEKIEDCYLKIFFKIFWSDARKIRFQEAFNKAQEKAQQNIKINDSILMQALKEIVN